MLKPGEHVPVEEIQPVAEQLTHVHQVRISFLILHELRMLTTSVNHAQILFNLYLSSKVLVNAGQGLLAWVAESAHQVFVSVQLHRPIAGF